MESMVVASPAIKVAAICGSIRKASFNRGLLRSAIEISEQQSANGMRIELVDVSPLPMINTDLEANGRFPPAVEAFRQKVLEADGILFASPEYNYSVTRVLHSLKHVYLGGQSCLSSHYTVDWLEEAPLKNAIDWASRPPNVWAGKAAAIVSAGGGFGGGRAQYHLRQIGVFVDLHFINKPEFMLNAFQPPAKFDSEGNLVDPEAKEKLKQVLQALHKFTLRLEGR